MAEDTSGVQISLIDLDNPRDVEGFHRVKATAVAADIPDFPPLTLREAVGGLTHEWTHRQRLHLLARRNDEVVGFVALSMPTADNLHLVSVDLMVDPSHRRQGIGRALFEAAIALSRERGRSVLIGDHVTQLPGGTPRDTAPAAFAAAMGAKPALPEVRRRLDLTTVDRSALERLHAEALAQADGYTALGWIGRTADDLASEVARLEGRMVTDAPMGELSIEAEQYDAARIQGDEAVQASRGHRIHQAAVRHDATGRLAAWTALVFDADTPDHAWQLTTIVDPVHRGHRLGTVVKLENLFRTLDHAPQLRTIDTWNAAENTHMIAINEAIGFRAVDGWVDWQVKV